MRLAEEERELVLAEAAEAMAQARSPERRAAWAQLREAAERGEVPEALLEPLQSLLEAGLESGRIRRVHTAHGEMAGARLYFRTPRGEALRAAAERVNEALRALAGHELVEATLNPAAPGRYTLVLATDRARLRIELDRSGPSLHSVEVG